MFPTNEHHSNQFFYTMIILMKYMWNKNLYIPKTMQKFPPSLS